MPGKDGWVFAYPNWYTQAEADQIRTQAMAEDEAAAETVAEAETITGGPGPEAEPEAEPG